LRQQATPARSGGILYAILVLRGGRASLFDKIKALPGLDQSLTLDRRDIVYIIAPRWS